MRREEEGQQLIEQEDLQTFETPTLLQRTTVEKPSDNSC